jgi:hypothetical protein
MKYHNTDSLVVIDDQSNSKKFKSFRNIETVSTVIKRYIPIKGKVLIKEGSQSFEIENENSEYWTDDMWNMDTSRWDKEEIFLSFFDEFSNPNHGLLGQYALPNICPIHANFKYSSRKHHIFSKKKYLDKIKKTIFKKVELLYFYKFEHYFPKKSKLFSLPKCIDTTNVTQLYISGGQIVDFKKVITPKKFPNLEKLIIDTDYKILKTFPSFENLEEIYLPKLKTKKKNFYHKLCSFKNLKNLKHIMIQDNIPLDNDEIKELYNFFGKNFLIQTEKVGHLLKKEKLI